MNRSVAYRSGSTVILLAFAAALVLARPGAIQREPDSGERFSLAGAGAQAPGPAPKAGTAPAGNAQNGKRIYASYGCYECHGREGQGSSATGPRLGPRPLPLEAFVQYVRQPAGDMPPYTGKIVSDSELADIHAFLESLPQPPAAKSIPLLNQ